MTKIAVGRYARVTSAARVDMIGQVIRHDSTNYSTVRVPNWQADGWHLDVLVSNDELERSTAVAARAAAAQR